MRILQEDNTVRIEVLNDEPSGVPLRALLQSPQFRRCSSSLPLPLGLGTDFRPEVLDLDAVADIMMTGQNNAELSTMMNVFIASLLYAVPRDNVRMVLMDLNGDGLSLWKGVSGVEYVYGDKEVCTVLMNLTKEQMERDGSDIRTTVVFISGFDETDDSGEGLSDLLKQLPLQGRHGRCHFIVSGTNIESSLMESLRDEERSGLSSVRPHRGDRIVLPVCPVLRHCQGKGTFSFAREREPSAFRDRWSLRKSAGR